MNEGRDYSFVVEGKLEIPFRYFAGALCSHFLTTLRDRKAILGVRCDRCEKVFVPPRSTCELCFEDLSEKWVEVASAGTVISFTEIRYQEPYQPCEPPYILALIRLDGADTGLAHIIRGADPSEVSVGLRVEAVFAEKGNGTILDIDHFKPAG